MLDFVLSSLVETFLWQESEMVMLLSSIKDFRNDGTAKSIVHISDGEDG